MRRFGVIVFVAMLLAVGSFPVGAAEAGGAVLTGSGTYTPGLTMDPVNQSLTMSGNLVGSMTIQDSTEINTATKINATCAFSGGSAGGESTAGGGGTLSGTCSGTAVLNEKVGVFSANCDFGYTRKVAALTLAGSCRVTVAAGATSITDTVVVNAALKIGFTAGPPFTSFTFAGAKFETS